MKRILLLLGVVTLLTVTVHAGIQLSGGGSGPPGPAGPAGSGGISTQAVNNLIAAALPTQTIFYACQYLSTTNTSDQNFTGLTNLLTAAQTNAVIEGCATKVTLNWPTNTASGAGFNWFPYNVTWRANNQTLNATNIARFNTGLSFVLNIQNASNLVVSGLNWILPKIGTNDTATPFFQDQCAIEFTGTNNDVRLINTHHTGGAFWLAMSGANYNFLIDGLWGNDTGNYQKSDGGLFYVSGRHVYMNNVVVSNSWNVVEVFTAAGGQTDCGDYHFENITGIDWMNDALIYLNNGDTNADSIACKNFHLSEPSRAANFPVYSGSVGFAINDAQNITLEDIYMTPTNLAFTGAGVNLIASNIVIQNFNGALTQSGDSIAGSRYSIRDSTFGSLTISANSTGSLDSVTTASLASNGVLTWNRDASGNLTVLGAGTFNSALTANSTLTGNGTFAFNGSFIGNSQVISNGGTLSSGQAGPPTNQTFFVDTSAGGFTNTQNTGAWAVNQTVTFIKTNAQNNPWYYKGSTASRVNTYNGQQLFVMSNMWDWVTFQKRLDNIVHVIGGNFASNMNVVALRFFDGTVQTTAANGGAPSKTNYAETTGLTFTNVNSRSAVSADFVLSSLIGSASYGAVIDKTAQTTNAITLPTGVAENINITLTLTPIGPNDVCIISNSAGAGASSTMSAPRAVY